MHVMTSPVSHAGPGEVIQLPLEAGYPGPGLLAAQALGVQLLAPPRRHPDVRHLLGDVVLVPPGVTLDVAHRPVGVLRDVSHLTPGQNYTYNLNCLCFQLAKMCPSNRKRIS